MDNFVHLFSTTNPTELSQIRFALEKDGINVKTKGESALGIGNVELTGISGADLLVHEDRLIAAKKVMEKIGYGLERNKSDDKYYQRFLIGFALVAFAVILFLVYTFIKI